jgi:hypothetical protein
LPPKSLTTAHCDACEPSPKVTPLICSGCVPSHDASLYESQKVWPGRQNWNFGLENGEVCPISQTNEFGVSSRGPS